MLATEYGERAVKYTTNRLMDRLHNSPDQINRLLGLLEHVPSDAHSRAQIRAVKRMREEDAPAGQLLDRALQQLNPRARHGFINNLVFHNTWGRGYARRQAWEKETGYMPPFTYLVSPSMRCNLHCTGCYASEYQITDDLPIETIDRVLEEGKAMGIHVVTILGGEPFVRRDMWDVYARHDDVYFQVFSNGTTLTEANVARLAALGNVAVAVSIEGWEAETDERRGNGTYAKIMTAFDRLREAGVAFGFSAMVTRHNIEVLCSDAFNQMLVDKGCLFGWHFLYMPIGRDPELDLMPTPEQREYLRTHGAARIRTTFPLFVADFWNDAPYVGGCIAGGKQYFHINSHGDVEPCIFTHFAADNIKEKSLAECLDSPFFKAIRSRQPHGENLLLPCMLIDHPQAFRDVYAETHPMPTHPGAEALVGELASGLDDYANRGKAIMDSAWQRDFVARGFVCPGTCPVANEGNLKREDEPKSGRKSGNRLEEMMEQSLVRRMR